MLFQDFKVYFACDISPVLQLCIYIGLCMYIGLWFGQFVALRDVDIITCRALGGRTKQSLQSGLTLSMIEIGGWGNLIWSDCRRNWRDRTPRLWFQVSLFLEAVWGQMNTTTRHLIQCPSGSYRQSRKTTYV